MADFIPVEPGKLIMKTIILSPILRLHLVFAVWQHGAKYFLLCGEVGEVIQTFCQKSLLSYCCALTVRFWDQSCRNHVFTLTSKIHETTTFECVITYRRFYRYIDFLAETDSALLDC